VLIQTNKHRADDLERWATLEKQDAVVARLKAHARKLESSRGALRRFAERGPFYAGTSWGKDSVCLAHLCQEVAPCATLVWVRIEPVKNPECLLVRDAFLGRYPGAHYHEEVVHYEPNETRWRPGHGPEKTREVMPAHVRGFRRVVKTIGCSRYASGIRAHESSIRKARMKRCGFETKNTCAPLGWWTASDVFAYLLANDLPVHPAYAYTLHGTWSRDRLRVDALWGPPGQGHGRRAWERHYYPDEYRAMARWCAAHGQR